MEVKMNVPTCLQYEVYGCIFLNGVKYIRADLREKPPENKTKWHTSSVPPSDDRTILVSWQDGDGRWANPIRAYYYAEDQEYYAIDTLIAVAINAAVWTDMPDMPIEGEK